MSPPYQPPRARGVPAPFAIPADPSSRSLSCTSYCAPGMVGGCLNLRLLERRHRARCERKWRVSLASARAAA
eukprot:624683-Pleurochrysis_carterae.AAC.2